MALGPLKYIIYYILAAFVGAGTRGNAGRDPRTGVLFGGGNPLHISHNVKCMWTHLLNPNIHRYLLRHTIFIRRLTVCSATQERVYTTLVCTPSVFFVF